MAYRLGYLISKNILILYEFCLLSVLSTLLISFLSQCDQLVILDFFLFVIFMKVLVLSPLFSHKIDPYMLLTCCCCCCCCQVVSVVSDSVRPHRRQPTGSSVPGTLQARTLEWVAISFSSLWKWKVKVKSLRCVQLFATPWAADHQAPPSMGFSRQECWSGVPLPSPFVFYKVKWSCSVLSDS